MHQVGLAHTYTAVQEQRIVSLGRAFGYSHSRCARKLVAAADHEVVKRVARIQLRRRGPVEARLFRRAHGRRWRRGRRVRRNRPESTIFALWRHRWILFGSYEAYVVKLQGVNVDRFLDQIAIFIADVLKLGRRDTNVEGAAGGMTIACRFEPSLERLADHLFF